MFLRLGVFDGKPESRRAALLDFGAETLGVASKRLALAHDPLGAPLLLIDGARGAWTVSSASRENVFLFGLARGEKIGVDVEIVRPLEPPDVALHPEESRRLMALPEAERVAAFYRLWTAKEAYIKALGVGLRRELTQIRVSADEVRISDRGKAVTLASSRVWREEILGKSAACAALALKP
jgi:phosphopantetheinyl transferase